MASGDATIAAHSTSSSHETLLYSSWFCPYAQRAWIALEEKDVAYKWIEINPYEECPEGGYTKTALSIEKKRQKYPAFVKCCPKGGLLYSQPINLLKPNPEWQASSLDLKIK